LFSVGRALAQAVLSPHDSGRRLVALDDAAARGIFRLIVSAAAVSADRAVCERTEPIA
jgi:hypothetical protein